MTRFAGVSIGASVAGFLSVGFSVDELVALYLQDLSIFIRGTAHRLKHIRLIPWLNAICKYVGYLYYSLITYVCTTAPYNVIDYHII